jgi:hypothetical protein
MTDINTGIQKALDHMARAHKMSKAFIDEDNGVRRWIRHISWAHPLCNSTVTWTTDEQEAALYATESYKWLLHQLATVLPDNVQLFTSLYL